MNRRKHPFYRLHRLVDAVYNYTDGQWLKSISRIVFTVALCGSVAFLSLLEFADPQGQFVPDALRKLCELFHRYRLIIACLLLGVQSVSGALIWLLDRIFTRSRVNHTKIETLLDSLVGKHCQQLEHNHIYRATVFTVRSIPFCPLFGRWLGIAGRSNKLYPGRSTIYSIDPESRGNNTGMVGECWWRAHARTGSSFHDVLPDLRANPDDTNLATEYKLQGYATDEEYERLSVKSCFFRVHEIRANGKIWGVLIFDSTDAQSAPGSRQQDSKQLALIENAAEALTLLLE